MENRVQLYHVCASYIWSYFFTLSYQIEMQTKEFCLLPSSRLIVEKHKEQCWYCWMCTQIKHNEIHYLHCKQDEANRTSSLRKGFLTHLGCLMLVDLNDFTNSVLNKAYRIVRIRRWLGKGYVLWILIDWVKYFTPYQRDIDHVRHPWNQHFIGSSPWNPIALWQLKT